MARPIDLAGSRVLVLGGSGVLGGALAASLEARGARVVLSGRDATRLQETASEIGAHVPSVLADLREPHHAQHAVSTTVRVLGGIDGIVNAAGVVAFGSVADLEDGVLEELVATDFTGPLRVIRAALPRMDGGFVVNISGLVAETPMPGMAAYSGVKAALSAATRALAKELRSARIHVMDARPPHTETGLVGRAIAGTAPSLGPGLDPNAVADTIVSGLVAGVRELAGADFVSA